MHIGMNQFVELDTGRTNAAGISLSPVCATDETGVCNGKRHLTYSFRAANQLRMGDSSFMYFLNKPCLGGVLSDYIPEKHINRSF
jgi:hypothetical protein